MIEYGNETLDRISPSDRGLHLFPLFLVVEFEGTFLVREVHEVRRILGESKVEKTVPRVSFRLHVQGRINEIDVTCKSIRA